MLEENKERLSKTEYDIDLSKIDFSGLSNVKPDKRQYQIKTGTLPVGLIKV